MPRATSVPVFYSDAYVLPGSAFDTMRKARWIADSLAAEPVPGVELREPRPLTEAELGAVHDPRYVAAVGTCIPRALAESQGFPWHPELWRAVCASSGGAVEAARAARSVGVAGTLSSGLHHARRGRGVGYCTFNGLALAARDALDAGARSVLVLDLDAHCGGGTQSLLGDDTRVWHADVAVSDFDAWRPSPRCTLDLVTRAEDYLPAVDARLDALEAEAPRFDLCLYNAGMDPFEGSAEGGLPGVTRDVLAAREARVFAWCRRRAIPVAFTIAGGYVSAALDRDGLVALHRLTLEAASREGPRAGEA